MRTVVIGFKSQPVWSVLLKHQYGASLVGRVQRKLSRRSAILLNRIYIGVPEKKLHVIVNKCDVGFCFAAAYVAIQIAEPDNGIAAWLKNQRIVEMSIVGQLIQHQHYP